MAESEAFQQFELSFQAKDRQWFEDFDLDALSVLAGEERVRAERLLSERLVSGRDPRAARALGVLRTATAVPVLTQVASLGVDEARLESILALWKLTGDTSLSAHLQSLMREGSTAVRLRVAAYAQQLGPALAVPILLEALLDADSLVRRNASNALIQLLGLTGLESPRGSLLWRLCFRLSLKYEACWKPAARHLHRLMQAVVEGHTPQSLGLTASGISPSTAGEAFQESLACDPGEDPWPEHMDLGSLKLLEGLEREVLVDAIIATLGLGDSRAPEALAASNDGRAIPVLLDALASASGRMHLEIAAALHRLTGETSFLKMIEQHALASEPRLRVRAQALLKQLSPVR